MRLWLAVCLVLAVARQARADEAIELAYTAPDRCPTADAFVARLQARAPVRVGGGARTFTITIEPTADRVHGSLSIADAGGTTVRGVDGETCDETVAALVVVAALAIGSPIPRVPTPRRREQRIVVGSGVALISGAVPETVLGVPAFAAFGNNRGVRVRVGFARTASDREVMSVGDTAFRLTTGRIDLSPLTFARGRFDVAPAIGVQLGALDARGTMVAKAGGELRPWVAPEASLRLRMLVDRFALELEGTIAAPLVRDRFFIAPATTVYEVPRVTAGLGLTLAVGLW